jgi:multidrug resistance efflux pump
MDAKPPIPIPLAQKWRQFRVQCVPIMVFCATLGCAVSVWREHVSPPALVDMAEVIQTNVVTPTAGILTNLPVTQYQAVKRGDLVAEVLTVDRRAPEAQARHERDQIPCQTIAITSPIDGCVSVIHRRRGENIAEGDPIVTISASEGSRMTVERGLPVAASSEEFPVLPVEWVDIRLLKTAY